MCSGGGDDAGRSHGDGTGDTGAGGGPAHQQLRPESQRPRRRDAGAGAAAAARRCGRACVIAHFIVWWSALFAAVVPD